MKIAIDAVTPKQIQVRLKVIGPDPDCRWCGKEIAEEGQEFCSRECWASWGGIG